MIIPAIDLIDGKVVRLYQGDYAQKTEYQYDPIDVVKKYAAAGAEILHIVDLSGAKDSHKRQTSLIQQMAATGLMRFQSGGGIRQEQDLVALLEAGVERIVIGSLAVSQRDLVGKWFEKYGNNSIVLALDVNIDENGHKMVATHGWQKDSGVSIDELLNFYQAFGLKHVLCTDISKDGTLQGSNTQLYADLVKQYPEITWQASGGIGGIEDIRELKSSHVQSVILGRSLLEGKFTLEEAIECWQDA